MATSIPEHHGAPTDPYRLFFPLGIALGIAGVSIWPLYYWGLTQSYSGQAHAFVQTNCFLYAFIVGFLWTAVPRFTGTAAPRRPVQLFLAALLVAEAAAFELYYFSLGHLLFALAYIAFAAVLMTCFLRRKNPPPDTFIHVGLGVIAGLIAAAVNAGTSFGLLAPAWGLLGRRLLSEGMVLLLVLGVGGFLGPRLLGFAQLPDLQRIGQLSESARPSSLNWKRRFSALTGLVLLVTVFVQYGLSAFSTEPQRWAELAGLARAAVATLVILLNLWPWRLPAARTTLSWCVWTAHWLLIIALWMVALFQDERTGYLHLMFMGAFTLLILAVGTRVVLSHGGYALAEERQSWPLRLGITVSLIAMSARVGAVFAASPQSYFSHLAWAAVLWATGMLIWGIYLVKKIRPGDVH